MKAKEVKKLEKWLNWNIKYYEWLLNHRLTKQEEEQPYWCKNPEVLIKNGVLWVDPTFNEHALYDYTPNYISTGLTAHVANNELMWELGSIDEYEQQVINRINNL